MDGCAIEIDFDLVFSRMQFSSTHSFLQQSAGPKRNGMKDHRSQRTGRDIQECTHILPEVRCGSLVHNHQHVSAKTREECVCNVLDLTFLLLPILSSQIEVFEHSCIHCISIHVQRSTIYSDCASQTERNKQRTDRDGKTPRFVEFCPNVPP